MKFTCDSCSAHYMISDEKVAPNGVKVRCKKCGNVILVRRVADPDPSPVVAAATADAEGASAATRGGNGLDDELGQAFENAFGDPPASTQDEDAREPGAPEDDAPAAAPAAPADSEWYVAIGQAQVGPLPLAEVKRKWEAGDVGPDSLVWRPGMSDWQPLTSVSELAAYLAPVPRAASQSARAESQSTRSEPAAARDRAAETPVPAAPAEEVTWKPVGASALAALANEEIATRAPEPARAGAPAGGVKSLVDDLPDGGGVDPTGSLPLNIKALEATGETKKTERRSTVASRAEETRHKRSVARVVVGAVVVVVLIVGGAAAYVVWQTNRLAAAAPATHATAAAPSSSAPSAAAPAAPVAAAPATAPAPADPAASAPVNAAAPAAAGPAAPAPSAPAPAEAAPPPAEAPRTAPARRVAKAEPTPHRAGTREAPQARAAAPAPAPAAPPTPAPAPARKKDSLLDFDSNDSALDEALKGNSSPSSSRSVYVPPARAGAPAVPDKLSPSQINESVAARIDSLRKCVSDQKARDPGTSGVLKLRWVISADGGVRDVKTLTTEFASSPFAQCISGVVRTIRFPRSATTGQEVTFPFSF